MDTKAHFVHSVNEMSPSQDIQANGGETVPDDEYALGVAIKESMYYFLNAFQMTSNRVILVYNVLVYHAKLSQNDWC